MWWGLIGLLAGTAILGVAYSAWQGHIGLGPGEWLGLAVLVPSAMFAGVTLSRWSSRALSTRNALADFVIASACAGAGYLLATADPTRPRGWLPDVLLLAAILASTVRRRLQTAPSVGSMDLSARG